MMLNKIFSLEIKFLFLIALIIRLLFISFYYFYEFNILVGPDSLGMHDYIVYLSEDKLAENKNLFYYLLSKIYSFFSIQSYIAACLIVVFFWCLGFYLFYKLIILIKLKKEFQFIIISIFCFWPSLIIFSITFNKEIFESFFLLLFLYSIVKLILNKKIKYIFISIFSIFFLSIMHRALFFSSSLIFFYSFFSYLILIKKININFLFIIFSVFLLFLYLSLSTFINLSYSQLSYGLPKAVSIYQNGLLFLDLRANYRDYPVFLNDYYDLTIFVVKATLDYFLAPYLYQITTFSDLVALFENLSRIVIIILICYRLYTNKINLSKLTFIIFFFFFAIEIIWAMGTSNWGTAIRHHSVALPILFISLAAVSKKINNTF